MAWRAVFLLLAASPAAGADGLPPEHPPLVLPTATEVPHLPAGVTVSRPLQPAAPPPTLVPTSPPPADLPTTPATTALMELAEVDHPLGHSWHTLELLLFWPRAAPLPPLVAAGSSSQVLIGGHALDTAAVGGGRFTVGFAVNPEATAGLAVSYLFLGTAAADQTVGDLRSPAAQTVGRPVVRADTGQPTLLPVTGPGGPAGTVRVATATRVTGWEVGGVTNLYASSRARVNALAGYRYFMANEGLRVEQLALVHGRNESPTLFAAADQFDAHNRFHGGQFGLSADFTRGSAFIEASGKVALGQGLSVVRVSGRTVAVGPAGVRHDPAGVLAQPSNSGRFVRGGFAVLPEGTLKVGYRLADRSRFYVGYDFLYLSEAARPGRQVDLTLLPGEVPLLGGAGGTADRPAPVLDRGEFWVQGLTFGLEYRY